MTSQLKAIVDFYRACDRPKLPDDAVQFSVEVDINHCREEFSKLQKVAADTIKELIIDGHDEELEHEKPLPATANSIEVTLQIPQGGSSRFYTNAKAMLQSVPSLLHGEIPQQFYLIEEDYFYAEAVEKPKQVATLEKLVNLIAALKKIAHRTSEINDVLSLMYLSPDESPLPRMAELKIKASPAILHDVEAMDLMILESLIMKQQAIDVHHAERKGIFINTLVDFIVKYEPAQAFEKIILNWPEVIDEYQKNLASYMSGFAFNKVRKQIANAQIEIAEKLASVISTIMGKALAVPISMLAVVAFFNADNIREKMILAFGVFIASLIVSIAIKSQKLQFKQVKEAKQLALESHDGEHTNYPPELLTKIEKIKSQLNTQTRKVGNWLNLLLLLAWIPFAVVGVSLLVGFFCFILNFM